MSENIPFDIQEEIIKRLPVKSLIRFRCVSKTWKSLIDSYDFIARYSRQPTRLQHLLLSYCKKVRCYTKRDLGLKYVSIVDDDTFPQQKASLTIPLLVQNSIIIGSSHGLLCLYNYSQKCVVIWNPLITKTVAVIVPNTTCGMYRTILGFGVCRETRDPKILKIRQIYRTRNWRSVTSIPWQFEVFTLSTWAWRNLHSNLPRESIRFGCFRECIDGFLYWLATDEVIVDGGLRFYNLIISFDMTSEVFREVNLPDTLAGRSFYTLSISKLRESLVVVEHSEDEMVFVVWMMQDGVSKVFTKLFTIDVNTLDRASIRGFRYSGEAIVEIAKDQGGPLVVYEPYSKQMDNLGIDGDEYSFHVYPYMESLLLLDQPNLTDYKEEGSGHPSNFMI